MSYTQKKKSLTNIKPSWPLTWSITHTSSSSLRSRRFRKKHANGTTPQLRTLPRSFARSRMLCFCLATRIVTIGWTRFSEHAQDIRFVFLTNQICQIWRDVGELRTPGAGPTQSSRLLVLSKRSATSANENGNPRPGSREGPWITAHDVDFHPNEKKYTYLWRVRLATLGKFS